MTYFVKTPGPLADLQDRLGELFHRAQRFGREGLFADDVEDEVADLFDEAIEADEKLDPARGAADSVAADSHQNVRRLLVVNHGRRLRWAVRDRTDDERGFIGGENAELRFKRFAAAAIAAGAGPCAANLAAHRRLLAETAEND